MKFCGSEDFNWAMILIIILWWINYLKNLLQLSDLILSFSNLSFQILVKYYLNGRLRILYFGRIQNPERVPWDQKERVSHAIRKSQGQNGNKWPKKKSIISRNSSSGLTSANTSGKASARIECWRIRSREIEYAIEAISKLMIIGAGGAGTRGEEKISSLQKSNRDSERQIHSKNQRDQWEIECSETGQWVENHKNWVANKKCGWEECGDRECEQTNPAWTEPRGCIDGEVLGLNQQGI